MLLKVLVYGSLCNIYSSRKLEDAVRENIHFMWLAGMNTPDHHTINRFRSERHASLKSSGAIPSREPSRSSMNRNPISAALSVKNLPGRLIGSTKCPRETDAEDPETKKKTVQKRNSAKRHWPMKLAEYAEKERIMGVRNSFSKTDPDTTFIRMKEDPMRNGQLKAGSNVQLSTRNQFIVHFSLHQKPTDTTTLIPHLESFQVQYGCLPEIVTADAGYGREENYAWLEAQQIQGYGQGHLFPQRTDRSEQTKHHAT